MNNNRNREIIKYNLAGIAMNLCLAAIKTATGIAVHSHAVMLDGINSLSDSISSVLSIASVYIAGRNDRDHPLGYGRLEYIGSMAVTVIVLYIGVLSVIEAIDGIIHKDMIPHYTRTVLIIMIVSLISKLIYGVVMRQKGRELDSAAMIMTDVDSLSDALISLGIIATILIYDYTGINFEYYICIAISLMIIHTGVGMIRDCADKIIGTKTDPELKKELIRRIIMNDNVLNVSNMMIHNYGEGVNVGSLNIDVDEDMKAGELTRLSHRLIHQAAEMGVRITSVGINGVKTDSDRFTEIWDAVIDCALRHENVVRVSELSVDDPEKTISFNVVQDQAVSDRILEEDRYKLREELKEIYPDMEIRIGSAIEL